MILNDRQIVRFGNDIVPIMSLRSEQFFYYCRNSNKPDSEELIGEIIMVMCRER